MLDPERTATTQARYERMAPVYDLMEFGPEQFYEAWRSELWSAVEGRNIVEAGVGTGKNVPYYPDRLNVTAFDLSPGMLAQAAHRTGAHDSKISLLLGDAQATPFAANSFDAGVATFVFCSVPNPHLGLRELLRIVKPDGRLYLLEHMRAANELAGRLMDKLNVLTVHLTGVNINRRTVENVWQSGWQLERIEDVGLGGVFKLLIARKPVAAGR